MGTRYRVQLRAGPAGGPAALQGLQGEIAALLDAVNSAMSTYQEDSELMRLNAAPAGQAVAVSGPLFQVLDCAGRMARLTDGAFDVTVSPLLSLWGFGAQARDDAQGRPSAGAIAAARRDTGHSLLRLDPVHGTVRKERDGVFIDLSGIAKGHAVDRIAGRLIARGSRDFLVEIGGEIRARGVNPAGRGWRIGVEQTDTGLARREAAAIVSLRDMAMATSGDYRNFRRLNGLRYPHIIDPASGRPVQHSLASVSVLHPGAMQADALATALLVMGEEQALRFAGQHQLPVLLISRGAQGPVLRRSPALSSDGEIQGGAIPSFCP